jgi:hypothetical protein
MSKALALAQHYFVLSNERRLDEIFSLFTASSTYSSSNTSLFLGANQIMAMQRAFFETFEDIGWTVNHVEETASGIVRFDFSFTGMTLDGEKFHRDGIEHVVVFDGKIQHVEVR